MYYHSLPYGRPLNIWKMTFIWSLSATFERTARHARCRPSFPQNSLRYDISLGSSLRQRSPFYSVKPPLSPLGRLGNQKLLPFSAVQAGRMNLHVIQMIQLNPMLFTNAQGVSCKTWIIGGMLIQTTDTSCRKHRILCMNMNNLLLFGFQCNPLQTPCSTSRSHPGMLHNSNIRTASLCFSQSHRYFFPVISL